MIYSSSYPDITYMKVKSNIVVDNRPILIAICGKSGVGKTYLSKHLCQFFGNKGYKVNLLISDTTRPPRDGEEDGVDYNFISTCQFNNRIMKHQYLEWTCFRKWYYGTDKTQIQKDAINICVVNKDGLLSMRHSDGHRYRIIPVYLTLDWNSRLQRSIDREGRIRLEHIRRIFADFKNFIGIKGYIKDLFKNYIMINCNRHEDVNTQCRLIYHYLRGMLPLGNSL